MPRKRATEPFFRLWFPWPPTLNTYYSIFGGRKILSRRGRRYKEELAGLLALKQTRLTAPERGGIEAVIELWPPDKRKRDWDNLHKAVFDSLTQAGIIEDDSLVKKATVEFKEPSRPGIYGLKLYRVTWSNSRGRWVRD